MQLAAQRGLGRLWFLGVMAALMLLVQPASATNFPQLSGNPVADQAGILTDAQEESLNQKLLAIESATKSQIAVATIASLEGLEIEDYGLMLGRRWAIGRKGVDDGIIILVAPKDRKMRIEVGVGLEKTVPDAFALRIINDAMKPRFKAGDFAGGIEDAVDMLGVRLGNQAVQPDSALQPAALKALGTEPEPERYQSEPMPLFLKVIIGLVLALIAIPIILLGYGIFAAIFSGGSRFRPGRGGSVSNWNSASSTVYVDASPTIINTPQRSYSSAPEPSYDPPPQSSSSSSGNGGRFRGGGASGSW